MLKTKYYYHYYYYYYDYYYDYSEKSLGVCCEIKSPLCAVVVLLFVVLKLLLLSGVLPCCSVGGSVRLNLTTWQAAKDTC